MNNLNKKATITLKALAIIALVWYIGALNITVLNLQHDVKVSQAHVEVLNDHNTQLRQQLANERNEDIEQIKQRATRVYTGTNKTE